MKTAKTIEEIRQIVTEYKHDLKTIGLVTTMGNLHKGHLTLVKEAQKNAEKVIVTIFVNPMQFDRPEDLRTYPRTLEQDLALLEEAGVDAVFTPTPEIMYPRGLKNQTYVEVPDLANSLEGALRPGHFNGVATVVSKFFNIIQPDLACFGEKDYQQLALIREMVQDMNFQIRIIGVPIVRHENGLAYSSRNNRLSPEELAKAPEFHACLVRMGDKLKALPDFRSIQKIIDESVNELDGAGFSTDDITVVDAATLSPDIAESKRVVILAAAYLGKVRLIDNLVVEH